MSDSWVTTMMVTPRSRLSADQRLHDFMRGARIEIAGRLVGKQQSWVVDQGPRNRHPLLLAARELTWRIALALAQTEELERSTCARRRGSWPLPARLPHRTAAMRRFRARWCARAN